MQDWRSLKPDRINGDFMIKMILSGRREARNRNDFLENVRKVSQASVIILMVVRRSPIALEGFNLFTRKKRRLAAG